ncbi:MAG TPA: hypothetical protein VMT85_10595 [Thermoanaerobaculia bacterium]|nr:hypothetical protein [Thermoanaerobaculia bacterium]
MRRPDQLLPIHPAAWLPLVLVVALGAVIAVGFWGFSYDDAFITYRYAERMAAGEGLTYNPGEWVLGTSAPGFAVLLAALSWLGRPLGWGAPQWGSVVGVFSIGAVCLLPVLAAPRGDGGRRLAAEAAVVSTCAAVLSLTLRWHVELLGAEALPVIALIGAAALVARSGRHDVVAGLLVALAATMRLDALLGGGALGAALWGHRRRLPVAYAAAALLPVVAWLGMLWLAFDSVLPTTLAAKQSELAADGPSYAFAQWRWLTRTMPLSSTIALACLAAAGVAELIRRRLWRDPVPLAIAGWVLALEVFYRMAAVPFAPWYHLPTVATLVLLAAFGAAALGRAVARPVAARRERADATMAPIVALLLVVPVLAPALAWLGSTWREPPDPRYAIYRQVGEHLRAASGREGDQGRAAAVEIGVLGYFSRRPILDLVGLVSPQSRAARAEGRQAALLLQAPPEVIVDVPLFHREYPVLTDPEIRALYAEDAAFEDPPSGRGRVVVRRLRERSAPGPGLAGSWWSPLPNERRDRSAVIPRAR